VPALRVPRSIRDVQPAEELRCNGQLRVGTLIGEMSVEFRQPPANVALECADVLGGRRLQSGDRPSPPAAKWNHGSRQPLIGSIVH
jgi:hypothetical protein